MLSGKREDVSQRIEAAGGTVKSSVTKKVDYLVRGPGAGNNKSADAARHGTAIIDEEQLYKMMGQPMPVAALGGL
jgi:NAD-dependent DNA ligase